jgi:uncharacterized cupin superfamily protein
MEISSTFSGPLNPAAPIKVKSSQVINIDELEYHSWSHGERFAGRMGEIAERLNASKLGYNLTIIPPGKCAFPAHSHYVNEEMFFVLEGDGELRNGEDISPIRKGDVIACPAGGPETAHQIINTSTDRELKFLAVSTALYPEICEYPDSGKTAIRHFPDAEKTDEEDSLRFVLKGQEGTVDYWDGED